MARELRRFFEQKIGSEPSAATAPAADRVVRLDHNSQPYRELVEALGNLERVLTEANDYPDAEDKEQRIAEVSAARRLLASAKVRVAAVAGLLGSAVVYFTHDLVTTAVGRAAAVVLDKIVALFGSIF
jgi:histidinol-phosphate/aromatic aminotransferase/cobyric acid decarboxylase-like protein